MFASSSIDIILPDIYVTVPIGIFLVDSGTSNVKYKDNDDDDNNNGVLQLPFQVSPRQVQLQSS